MAVIQPRRHPCDSHGEPEPALRPGRDSLPGPSSSSAWHTPYKLLQTHDLIAIDIQSNVFKSALTPRINETVKKMSRFKFF